MSRRNIAYQLTIRKQAVRVLLELPGRYAGRIRGLLNRLAQDPQRPDFRIEPLPGNEGFRLLAGEHRVIFDRYDDTRMIEVLRIGWRTDTYKLSGAGVCTERRQVTRLTGDRHIPFPIFYGKQDNGA